MGGLKLMHVPTMRPKMAQQCNISGLSKSVVKCDHNPNTLTDRDQCTDRPSPTSTPLTLKLKYYLPAIISNNQEVVYVHQTS